MALEDERFRLLVRQWCEDHRVDPDAHGAQSKIARAFGNLSPSTVHKILSGDRGAGEDVRDKAAKALRLDPAFFKVAHLGPRKRYTQWQRSSTLHRDVHEMSGVTEYFATHPEHERFRERVNRDLHSSTGDVSVHVVRGLVRGLEDEEEAAKRQSR